MSSVHWYSSLQELYDSLDKFLVAWENKTGKGYTYAAFDWPGDFLDYRRSQRMPLLFHEIVPYGRHQKMCFDLDIPGEQDVDAGWWIVSAVVEAFRKAMRRYNVKISLSRDVRIFSSHRLEEDKEPKLSFHIVINDYCFASSSVAKHLCNLVVEELEASEDTACLCQYIDQGIYSPNHLFRLVGSAKAAEPRHFKQYEPIWSYYGKAIEMQLPDNDKVDILMASLVTWKHHDMGRSCQLIKVTLPPEETSKHKKKSYPMTEADAEAVAFALDCLGQYDKEQAFEADGDPIGNVIHLKRTKASYCELCEREHEHENQFLVILPDKVILKCYKQALR